jgi:DNA-binding MarR family transcriptional regulator
VTNPHRGGTELDDIADAVLRVAQLLIRVAATTLEQLAPDLNLSEFRALALLQSLGPQRLIDIAAALDVTPTTATRIADKLTAAGLVERVRLSRDRREIHLAISSAGTALVGALAATRRQHLSDKLTSVSTGALTSTLDTLRTLAGQTVPLPAKTA